jgi:hypothetical protein
MCPRRRDIVYTDPIRYICVKVFHFKVVGLPSVNLCFSQCKNPICKTSDSRSATIQMRSFL